MDVAVDAIKCILYIFGCSCGVGVVTGDEYEVGDRFVELKVVGMLFNNRGKHWKPNLEYVLVLSTIPLFHLGKFVSKTCLCQRSEKLRRIVYLFSPNPFTGHKYLPETQRSIHQSDR